MGFKVNQISHVAISCQSMDESLRFYTEILGFTVDKSMDDDIGHIKLDIGANTYIELFPFFTYESSGRGSLPHFALSVDSLDDVLSYLNSHNINILRGPFEFKSDKDLNNITKIAFIAGPDGEEIELIEKSLK